MIKLFYLTTKFISIGMFVSSLFNVPSNKYNSYVYLVTSKKQIIDWVNEEMSKISVEVGERNLFIHSAGGDLTKQLHQYLKNNSANEFVVAENFFMNIPSLIISKNSLQSTNESIKIIPLTVEKEKYTPEDKKNLFLLLHDIMKHIANGTLDEILMNLGSEEIELKNDSKFILALKWINRYIEMKPGFWGVSANLNVIIEEYIKKCSANR